MITFDKSIKVGLTVFLLGVILVFLGLVFSSLLLAMIGGYMMATAVVGGVLIVILDIWIRD
jgi:hypothetical protein